MEVLSKEIAFLVTEQQCSLFLHLLDWTLAAYYSFKRLKGRDDIQTATIEDARRDGKDGSPAKTTSPSSPDSSVSESQMGWGSWVLSFVAEPEEEESKTRVSSIKPAPPSLSLGLYAQHISINFKVSLHKSPSLFYSSHKKMAIDVMFVELLGCTARVNRVPTTSLLSFSVEIMSQWVHQRGVSLSGDLNEKVTKSSK